MLTVSFGILPRASVERSPNMDYSYRCYACNHELECSATSAAMMYASGLGICTQCGDVLSIALSGGVVPESLDLERKQKMEEIISLLRELRKTTGTLYSIDS